MRHVALAPDQLLAWVLEGDGSLVCFRPDNGALVSREPLLSDSPPTAAAFAPGGSRAAFGLADGKVRLADLEFVNTFLDEAKAPAELQRLRRRGTG